MRKERRVQNFVIALFGIAIVAMSIGFAAYSATLTIGGSAQGQTATSATFKKSKWSIHYKENSAQTTANSTSGAGQTLGIETNNTNVYFTATLNKPGDKYEFTVVLVNDGTYDANLTSVDMTQLTAAQAKYIDYTINYDGQNFAANTTGTSHTPSPASQLLAPTGSATSTEKTATVTVTYKQPADAADLPQTQDVTVNFSAAFNFDEAV